ncbi:hypothetical protein HJG60_010230 [Phyllostomus discolor]|uniref:Uncharacterized protein n=1 Tax=Phyllostomus discolor TaxID=89673 RepID=A0A834AWB7_9CHIR|nr:hypothetical protein HJG60_010230 [Phyllostomus discolor]
MANPIPSSPPVGQRARWRGEAPPLALCSRVLLRTVSGGTRESRLPLSALRAAVSALEPRAGNHRTSRSAVYPVVQHSLQPLVPGTQPAFHSRVWTPFRLSAFWCHLFETRQSCTYLPISMPKYPEVNQPGSFSSCSLGTWKLQIWKGQPPAYICFFTFPLGRHLETPHIHTSGVTSELKPLSNSPLGKPLTRTLPSLVI